jgi:hypothetical protein
MANLQLDKQLASCLNGGLLVMEDEKLTEVLKHTEPAKEERGGYQELVNVGFGSLVLQFRTHQAEDHLPARACHLAGISLAQSQLHRDHTQLELEDVSLENTQSVRTRT